jgi:hypothetical protein
MLPADSPYSRRACIIPPAWLAAFLCLTSMVVSGCKPHGNSTAEVRAAIQQQLDRAGEATRAEDINTYMDCIPEDFRLKDEQGAAIARDELRKNILRDWAIIPRTIALETKIDSLEVHGAEATVYTSQRWEREMLERDGKTIDTVLTTQKHREKWRNTARGWMGYEVKELGGDVFVNGKPYKE